jgi:hypothetical protein
MGIEHVNVMSINFVPEIKSHSIRDGNMNVQMLDSRLMQEYSLRPYTYTHTQSAAGTVVITVAVDRLKIFNL